MCLLRVGSLNTLLLCQVSAWVILRYIIDSNEVQWVFFRQEARPRSIGHPPPTSSMFWEHPPRPHPPQTWEVSLSIFSPVKNRVSSVSGHSVSIFFSNILKKEKETNTNGYVYLEYEYLKFISLCFLVSACHLRSRWSEWPWPIVLICSCSLSGMSNFL